MSEGREPVDPGAFAVRREVRDLLARLLGREEPTPDRFEKTLAALRRRRRIAVRQLLRLHREGRVRDEIVALELLGRLAEPEDHPALAAVANDPDAPESARVACALVLLGQDRPGLLTAPDISTRILRWQARFVADEPTLRAPLVRLYLDASPEERARWIALQDRELTEPEGRAAVFEMLLEVEEDPDLRIFLLEGLARVPHPAVRAAMRRVRPLDPEEADIVTGALAALAATADPETVPAGWSARVGFCDGTGSFPLRFDFRLPGRRPKAAVFVVNLLTGVRDALPLTGSEVDHYDALGAGDDDDADGAPRSLLYSLPVPEALGLLLTAERRDEHDGREFPLDHEAARRILDPLADLRPRLPAPPAIPLDPGLRDRSAELLEHPGYAGWFYDAGDHELDDLRLEVLRTCTTDRKPSAELVDEAARRLVAEHEPRRLVRMLRHNATVHALAGEREYAAIALATAMAIATGGFARTGLVRRMLEESLHPGHYFFTPVPEGPERHDVARILYGDRKITRGRVFTIELATILARAMDVWHSRIPSLERPTADQVQGTVFALARAGAREVLAAVRRDPSRERPALDGLERVYRRVLDQVDFPSQASDPDHAWLLSLLVGATRTLVEEFCARCPGRCLADPRADGRELLDSPTLPAGPAAEMRLRTWPGIFLHDPSPEEESALAAYMMGTRLGEVLGRRPGTGEGPYRCAVCGEVRPRTTLSRSVLLPHDGSAPGPVCRRCQGRYRRDPEFRARVVARQGKLVPRGTVPGDRSS